LHSRKTIREQVRDFNHAVSGQPARGTPGIPDDKWVDLSIKLVVEEFFELISACFGTNERNHIASMQLDFQLMMNQCKLIDLPALADACADLDYVVESLRQKFGINGEPIADLVHAANMTKLNGPVDPVTGKKLKPPGFQPPDIDAELRRQGWQP